MSLTKQWFKQVGALIHARNLEFFRDRAALSWNILFPLLLIGMVYFAFDDFGKYNYKVGVIAQSEQAEKKISNMPLSDLEHIKYITLENTTKGLNSLNRFGIDMLVSPTEKTYWFNAHSSEGYFLDKYIQSQPSKGGYTRVQLDNLPVRFTDWIWVGILVINLMYGCLYGIGNVIVRYRKNGHLKRLQVTPITVAQFLMAQVISRVGIVFVSTFVVVLGSYFLLHPRIAYPLDWGSLAAVALLGTLSFISLGLLLCSRVTSEELSRGLIELVSWPMLICSGAWFSLEGTHPWLQQFAYFMPSTHFIEGLRQIALYGANLSDVAPHLSFLALSTFLFFLAGIMLFKWQNNPT